MDWKKIFNHHKSEIDSFQKLHSRYKFTLKQTNQTIKVNIWENSDGTFTGLTNYSIKNTNQLSHYRDYSSYHTPDEALEKAISGITMYYQPPYDQIDFKLEEEY
ncbi:hypothetical protein IQ238_14035 [Pleurocapsales cyanobacterium LEGE 06147]|nr:hypothetical protein [Pleurocapsales cyanobacterium LEGE 06147]